MSPTDRNMPGIKGKRIPGRPGRFDPSEPLHMTTRRAAKGGPNNGSPSLNGSIGDDESRRGSFDDARPFTSHSTGSQVSAKSRRLSDVSVPHITLESIMNGIHPFQESAIDEGKFQPLPPPFQQSPSPSRKRKRSSSPALPSTPLQPNSTAPTSFENKDDVVADDDDMDTVEVVHPDDLSDREVPPSQASSQSAEDAPHTNGTLMAQSMDATPAVSGQISPATSDSNSPDQFTNAKQLGAALEIARAEQDEQDEQYEIEDAADVAEDLDDGDEVDEQARFEDGGPSRRGRFGGRRRAKHAIPRVERAMQRQSELKSAYRAIARAQKAVLAEIAQRTVDTLDVDAEAHLRAAEYEDVRAGLADALEERRARIQAQHELNLVQLKSTLDSHSEIKTKTTERQAKLIQDQHLDRLEAEILRIARAAQMDGINTGDNDTEDEDDVIPKPKGMGYRWKRSGALNQSYDSRSRLGLETHRAFADMEKRLEMQKMLDNLPDEDKPPDQKNFSVRDNALRDMAVQRRYSKLNTKTLAEAAAEIERLQEIERATRVIPNEEALGLQLLGDLASRPSITGSAPPPGRSKKDSQSYVGQTPPRPMPPHLQLQTHNGPSRIPVEMSPRTTQALNNRYETSRHLPATPRQEERSFHHSAEATRNEFQLQSPPSKGNRSDVFALLSGRQSGPRPKSQGGPLADSGRRPDESPRNHEQRPGLGASPFISGGEGRDQLPRWRDYPEQRSVFERRPSSHDERPRFGFMAQDGRPPFGFHDARDTRDDQSATKTATSPTFSYLHSRPPHPQDLASQPGATHVKEQGPLSPKSGARRATMDLSGSPRSRHSGTFSVHDFRSNSDTQQKYKVSKNHFPLKTSKAERDGRSRRQHSFTKDTKFGRPLSKPGPASAISPSAMSPTFAGSPVERSGPPPPWQPGGPPLRSPLGPPPPSAFGQAHPFGRPPTSFLGNYGERHHSRESFQSQPPASIWNQPSPSPLWAVPQQPHPPPPGVPPDQYNRFGPPPPPGFPPPPPPPAPQTPQSAPGSYGHQFGGPPLAPATTNQGYHPPGFRPSQPLPAFAQQAQQQQQQQQSGSSGGGGHRRRTQSDASFPKFQPWHPPSGSRRP